MLRLAPVHVDGATALVHFSSHLGDLVGTLYNRCKAGRTVVAPSCRKRSRPFQRAQNLGVALRSRRPPHKDASSTSGVSPASPRGSHSRPRRRLTSYCSAVMRAMSASVTSRKGTCVSPTARCRAHAMHRGQGESGLHGDSPSAEEIGDRLPSTVISRSMSSTGAAAGGSVSMGVAAAAGDGVTATAAASMKYLATSALPHTPDAALLQA